MAEKKKSHSEREAEAAKRLGLKYTKSVPIGATNSSIGRANVSSKSKPRKTKRK